MEERDNMEQKLIWYEKLADPPYYAYYENGAFVVSAIDKPIYKLHMRGEDASEADVDSPLATAV